MYYTIHMSLVNAYKKILSYIIENNATEFRTSETNIPYRDSERAFRDLSDREIIADLSITPEIREGESGVGVFNESGEYELDGEDWEYPIFSWREIDTTQARILLEEIRERKNISPLVSRNVEEFGATLNEEVGFFKIFDDSRITYKNKALDLPPQSKRLLELFLRRMGEQVNKNDIVDVVWAGKRPDHNSPESKEIYRLNKKLMEQIDFEPIQSHPGQGYIFNSED